MISVILMMAGNGTRMKTSENKVYLPLKNKSIYQYSLDLFLANDFEVICVIRKEDEKYLTKYLPKIKIAYGGQTRQMSVYNGLKKAKGEFVLIHDAARPFITQGCIDECVSALNAGCCVLVGCDSKDSIYSKNPLKALDRKELFNAQTPQGGNIKTLLLCHEQAIKDGYISTDDISLVLKYSNEMIKLVDGTDINFKITTQLDYITAKELIKND